MAEEKNTPFNYLLNAMERAAQAERPADHGYGEKRKALLAHVRELERKAVAPGSEPFERWRKELRVCIVQLLYVAHESKSPAECKAHPRYSDVMRLVDGGPALATYGVQEVPRG